MFYIFLLLFSQVFCDSDMLTGFNYINLHCRDNFNSPVDWWIIYKPPSDIAYLNSGRNFTYISSKNAGSWLPSDQSITSNSMLQLTLSPMFRPTYSDYLAMVTYDSKDMKGTHAESSPMGIMLADEVGGLWIGHTVHGLPDLSKDRSYFPDDEIKNGHMIMCLSLDLITLNEMARSLRELKPEILTVKIPEAVKDMVPDWLAIREPSIGSKSLKKLNFMTKEKSLQAYVLVRHPGTTRCLYETFAKSMKIDLDVYGHDKRSKTICEKDYSVRKIEAISLKHPEKVYYINNKTDRLGFAVSTINRGQRVRGDSKKQYWTCVSNSERKDDSKRGGFIICLEDYYIWRSFDNFKIKDPVC